MSFNVAAVSLCFCLMLAGCASTEFSEQVHSDTVATVSWPGVPAQAQPVTRLDALLNLPVVHPLISEALSNNPGLQQTLITLQQAEVSLKTASAARRPQLSAGLSGSRDQHEQAGYTAELNVSWELDLWRKIGDNIQAGEWSVAGAEANLQAAKNALAANVMRAYLEVIAQTRLLAIEHQRLQVLENSGSVILARYRSGLSALDDLDNARTSSASSRAAIAKYETTLASARRALAVLLGRRDTEPDDIHFDDAFPEVVLPLPGLPQQDLSLRPDLQAAYYAIRSSEALQRVAYKSLLPSIDIGAALTDSGATPAQALFANPAWRLLGQITAPLFQGGELRANIDLARLDTLNSWWVYQDTLLTAVQEVQDAIDQEKSLATQQHHVAQALVSARRSADSFSGKYRQGLVDILDLLSVYQTTFDLQAQLVQLQLQQLSNRVDLGLALGLGVEQGVNPGVSS